MSASPSLTFDSPRKSIYYWKCDRSATFHGIAQPSDAKSIEQPLLEVLKQTFPGKNISLSPGTGQGNHLTWVVAIGDKQGFVRVEDGPEKDDYIDVESHLIGQVAKMGVPVAYVLASDASRSQVPFAWQVLERMPYPDINTYYKKGEVDTFAIARQAGQAVARWQGVQTTGFGPFSTDAVRQQGKLIAYHDSYADYFFLNLERHLHFLETHAFISPEYGKAILHEIQLHERLLDLKQGCLVHKDLALWNMLGTPTEVHAFIDWDDAISGDPMDDLSLLGCFHNGATVTQALMSYASVRPLPENHRLRLWLHLLRNMIFKAVIRVGAGYFDRDNSFYLAGSPFSDKNLREFTLQRMDIALHGLHRDRDLDTLP